MKAVDVASIYDQAESPGSWPTNSFGLCVNGGLAVFDALWVVACWHVFILSHRIGVEQLLCGKSEHSKPSR